MTLENKGTKLTTTKAIDITEFSTIQSMGEAFFKSGMFSDIRSAAQAVVKIAAGKELGLPAIYSMQNINLIRNRLTTSANTMAMLVKKSGNYNYRIKEHHDKSCTITFFEREDDKWVEVGESTFTIEDAKRADLVKPDSGWVKYPRAMLFSRAISQGARLYAPDAIGGVYTDEEIRAIPPRPEEDNEPPIDITKEVIEEKLAADPIGNAAKCKIKTKTEQETVPEPLSNAVQGDLSPIKEESSSSTPKTFGELAMWVENKMGWEDATYVKSWLVNACKIPEKDLKDIDYCYNKIKELQGW